ncbi:M14 family zinc carboxypeptidase [uncultured Modestobacter sp.]|uniref:M14 family zinc carboxypeptidase n=1 Tax=uncultured Modestobacter sp. TaxID=380048 RepID=UPI002622796A|nr:M14 family zinc carboxypeptidase [uncultured Modestobacter sp.]
MTATPAAHAPGSVEDVLDRAGRVPPLTRFPSVDALNASFAALGAAHPELLRHRRIGTSRLGEPLHCWSVGDGPAQHLVVAGVHPNEPIGSHTALHLVGELCRDDALRESMGATWHVVPCIDPDGMRLNEGWFDGPFDRGHYARHFYRPAPDEQVEWSFPFAYRDAYFDQVMPETLALMRLIDEVRPQLYTSLHNGELGGVYYYVSRALPGLVEALHALPERLGLPLEKGEPEDPFAPVLGTAVFGMQPMTEVYDQLAALGLDPAGLIGGSSSSEYARRHGTLCLVAELPYWSHPDSDDTSASGRTYADVLLEKAAGLAETGAVLSDLLARAEPLLHVETPFLRGSRAFVPMLGQIAQEQRARAEQPGHDRPATVAEVFSAADHVRCFRLRYGGMLVRALAAEVVAGTAAAPLRTLHEEASRLYEEWQQQAAELTGTQLLPIATLVGVQYGAVLATAGLLAAGRPG